MISGDEGERVVGVLTVHSVSLRVILDKPEFTILFIDEKDGDATSGF